MPGTEPLNSSKMPGTKPLISFEMEKKEPLISFEMEKKELRLDEGSVDSSTVLFRRNEDDEDSSTDSKARKICIIGTVAIGIIILSVVVVLGVKLLIANQRQGHDATITVITSLKAAHNVLNKLNTSEDPCNNFWKYSCGEYIQTRKPLQTSKFSLDMNVKAEMQRSIDENVIALLEEPNDESTIEPVRMIKKLYKSCTNKDTISMTLKADLINLSETLGGIPMITGRNVSGNHSSILHRYFTVTGKLPFFNYYVVESNQKRSSIVNFHSTFRSYSESVGNMAATMKILFSEYIDFENVFYFYNKLATLTGRRYFKSVDDFSSGFLYTSHDLNQILSGLDLMGIFDDILNVTNETSKNARFMTEHAEILKDISSLILKTHPTDFMNIVFLETLQEFYGVIPAFGIHFVKSFTGGVRTNTYASKQFLAPQRRKSCLDVTKLAGDVLGWMYSEKHFDEEVEDEVSQMVSYLLRAAEKLLSEVNWVDTKSKYLASQRLEDLKNRIHIGRQNTEKTKDNLIKSYADVSLTHKFLSNIVTMSKVSNQLGRRLKNNKTIVNQNDVNAVYNALSNSITIPVALMKPPLFIKGAPMPIKLGGLGTLIGHEILHALDVHNQNSQFKSMWLTKESQDKYNVLKQTVIKSYSGYRIKSLNTNVNGERTAEENIADLGGLNIAYKAYLLWKSDYPHIKFHLPGVNQTDTQMFFTAYSQASCSSEKPETVTYSLLTDKHAPVEARVQVPLRNYDEFAESFDCSKGTYMNPGHKIKIW
ncbi:membrane metallo-endopeptidase-like 1 isoform X2 [Octopus sinensis]|uniref:Membrane metallo-endopeptidase-like 1 isoform X2 n=1 Tax=Octopus sinensis TaxID=2607531 RepID=A0A7E6F0F5_9MOLL|nr:membrane metallo-endopeptidase-like 1 isoform X2 [Octopus sinensis]